MPSSACLPNPPGRLDSLRGIFINFKITFINLAHMVWWKFALSNGMCWALWNEGMLVLSYENMDVFVTKATNFKREVKDCVKNKESPHFQTQFFLVGCSQTNRSMYKNVHFYNQSFLSAGKTGKLISDHGNLVFFWK